MGWLVDVDGEAADAVVLGVAVDDVRLVLGVASSGRLNGIAIVFFSLAVFSLVDNFFVFNFSNVSFAYENIVLFSVSITKLLFCWLIVLVV